MKVLYLDESGDHDLVKIDASYSVFVIGEIIDDRTYVRTVLEPQTGISAISDPHADHRFSDQTLPRRLGSTIGALDRPLTALAHIRILATLASIVRTWGADKWRLRDRGPSQDCPA